MRIMGLRSLAPGPNTSRKHPAHPVYPYLLRDRVIDGPNQAWCCDVTYVPMVRGYVYLMAIMDWHTRQGLLGRQRVRGAIVVVAQARASLGNLTPSEAYEQWLEAA